MRTEVINFNKKMRKTKKDMFDFRAGDVVKVYRKIKEGEKERIQVFEGMIISIKGGQSSSQMMTVRKVSNGVGIEIIVPVLSPAIEKIELVKRAKVRHSKLYYVRDKAAKALRFKFTDKSEIIKDDIKEKKSTKQKKVKSENDTGKVEKDVFKK